MKLIKGLTVNMSLLIGGKHIPLLTFCVRENSPAISSILKDHDLNKEYHSIPKDVAVNSRMASIAARLMSKVDEKDLILSTWHDNKCSYDVGDNPTLEIIGKQLDSKTLLEFSGMVITRYITKIPK